MGVDLIDITAKRAALTPDRTAFADADAGVITYGELEARAARCASVLAAHGVEREDRVAILCRNRVEFFEIMFACAKLGAILAPLNWRAPAAELALLIADCTPKVLFFGAEDAACADALASSQLVSIAIDADYAAQRDAAAPARTDRLWRGDAVWASHSPDRRGQEWARCRNRSARWRLRRELER